MAAPKESKDMKSKNFQAGKAQSAALLAWAQESETTQAIEAWNAYLTNIIDLVNDGWPTPGDQVRMDAKEFEVEQMWVRSGVQL